MGWFIAVAAGIWVLGHIVGTGHRARLVAIAALYFIALLAVATLPETNPALAALEQSLGEWLLLGGVAALALLYIVWLRWLRSKASPPSPQDTQKGPFRKEELSRYARHIMLREIGGTGQKRLKEARVLIIGAGGLGSPALMYLAAAGTGTIGVIDDDAVETTNLQRQIAHSDQRTGMPKVFSAERAMKELNPSVDVHAYHRRLTEDNAAKLVADFDIVLDGSDNFDTRYLANRVCAATQKPLVSAALTQWEGQISVFDPARGTPCYQCVFPKPPAAELAPSCAEAGVLGPLPGVLGTMMAVEAIKLIVRAGEPLRGRMMIYDALFADSRTIGLTRREDCRICGNRRN